jgi:hypothetical protein
MVERTELPVPDYDHLPLGSVAHRIRALDVAELEVLLDHERAHGNRLPVMEVLTHRLESLRTGADEPSGGDPAAAQPEHAPPPSTGAGSAPTDTVGTNQPLRHGVAGQTPNRQIRTR